MFVTLPHTDVSSPVFRSMFGLDVLTGFSELRGRRAGMSRAHRTPLTAAREERTGDISRCPADDPLSPCAVIFLYKGRRGSYGR